MRRLSQATAGLLLFSIVLPPVPVQAAEVASPEDMGAPAEIEGGGEMGLLSDPDVGVSHTVSTVAQATPSVNEELAMGGFGHAYTFSLPPGRSGLTPELALSYNSNERSNDSFVGYGWNFSVPSISRINRHGSDVLYNYDDFVSSLSGELVKVSTTTYRAKVDDGSFLTYTFSNNRWVVRDKAGMQYTFGTSTLSRQDDIASSTRIYKWMLEEVRDPNSNFIRYEYFKDQGQVYPAAIYYTGSGTTDGVFKIVFNRAAVNMSPDQFYADFEVRTDYRISSVEIFENGQWVRRYDLGYTFGDNGRRPLLYSITENARDGTGPSMAKPPTTFTYEAVGNDITWTKTTGGDFELPHWLYDSDAGQPSFLKIQDLNADAYPDIILSPHPSSGQKVYINDTNGGWDLADYPNEWVIPLIFGFGTAVSDAAELVDYNGDQINDLLASTGTGELLASSTVKRGNATSTNSFSAVSGLVVPVGFMASTTLGSNGTQMLDFNGDGLSDIVYGWLDDDEGPGMVLHENTWRNTGFGWATSTGNNWTLPWGIVNENPDGPEVFTFAQFVDLNGDGLVDFMYRRESNPLGPAIVGINNGHGWTIYNDEGGEWREIPVTEDITNWAIGRSDQGMRAWDMNGDGLVDITGGVGLTRLDEWDHFNGLQVEAPLAFTDAFNGEKPVTLADINADGAVDFLLGVKTATSTDYQTYLSNTSPFTDLLVGIRSAEGASTTIAYKLSTQYKDGSGNLLNPTLPIAITTLESVTVDDGFGNTATDTYTYAQGSYYFNNSFDRMFAGFGLITRTDPAGNVTKTYFHQGNTTATSTGEYQDHIAKRGKPYRVEQYDDSGNLHAKTINKWDRVSLGNDASFVKLIQSIESSYDGDADRKDKATEYFYYDSTGNLATTTIWGEVTGSDDGTFSDTGLDKFTTALLYAASSTAPLSRPSYERLTNQSGTKVKEGRRYYDTLTLGSVSKGNETKTEQWRTSTSYASTTQTFNSLGLVTQSRDPLGRLTTYAYDSFNLYPATTTNPLSHTVIRNYDYSSGKVATTTDLNGRKFVSVYDGFDRLIIEKQPDIGSPSTLVTKKTYAYTDTVGSRKITETAYLDGSTSALLYTYLDGLDRKIQTRKEAESNYAVRDFTYNSRGLLFKESFPYFSSGTAKTTATTDNTLYTSYSYDALRRVVSASNAVGTTASAYDQWVSKVTDLEGNIKDFGYDAYGNLVFVVERNGGAAYTTSYEYDGGKNLTKITDADGNVRNFTYDGIGRRLTAQDIHDSLDGTYGTWTYTYDLASNLTSQVDPKNQTVNFTYDNLNRVLTENYTGQTGTEVTYGYDTCAEGKPRLCSATTTQAVVNYTYNALGLAASETKRLNNTNFVTSYAYDRLGNFSNIYYPGNFEIRYSYNTAGLLETVEQRENSGSYSYVVSNFDYAPTEKVITKELANGVGSAYTYDPAELYRLKKIETTLGGIGFLSNPWDDLAGTADFWRLASLVAFEETEPVNITLEEGPTLGETETPDMPELSPTQEIPEVQEEVVSPSLEESVAEEIPEESIVPETPESIEQLASTTPEIEATTTPDKLPEIVPEPEATSTPEVLPVIPILEIVPTSIRALIIDLGAKERANIKGREIAKLDHSGEFIKGEHRIDIVAVEAIEGGVQIFARASKNEKPLGFGADGSVETERFRIYNPPIMVPDEQGEYEQRWTDQYGIEQVTKYREDPKEALRQVLDHAISLTGKEDAPIEKGKVGNTTSIFYPSAGSVAPVDSYLRNDDPCGSPGCDWSVIRNDSTATGVFDSTTVGGVTMRGGTTSNKWRWLDRSIIGFDTNALNGDLVTSGTVSVAGQSKTVNLGLSLVVDHTTPASSDEVIVEDYDTVRWDGILQSNTAITFSSFALFGTYNDFPLNTNGIGNVDGDGYSWFGFRSDADFNDDEPTYDNAEAIANFYFADQTGTTNDPKLTLVHTTQSAPTAPTDLLTEGATNPVGITDPTPEFSAIFNDPTGGSEVANYYRVQVATSTSFTSTIWDSQRTAIGSTTPEGMRSPDISFPNSGLASSTTYYWRIKFWDFSEAEGAWSTATSSFSLASSTGSAPGGIQNISLTYSASGNIVSIVDTADTGAAKTLAFGYDGLHRLTHASTTAASSTPFLEQYAYSPLGNITGWKQNSSATTTYSYSETGSTNPHAATTVGGVGLKYDTNGNLTNFGVKSYTFDWRNRVATSSTGVASTTYAYDHTFERVKKTAGSVTTLYANDYFNKAGATTTRQVYAHGELIATSEGNGVATTTSYMHADHLGSTNAVTDESGEVVQVLDYYPFGSERIDTGTDVSQRQYIGEMYDEESSMSYLNARYYQNTRGQFISQDPVFWEVGITSDGKGVLANPQAQNSYSYAGNNPIINKDPTGRIAPLLVALGYVYFAYNTADLAVDAYTADLVTRQYPNQFSQTDRNNAWTEVVVDVASFGAGRGLTEAGKVTLDTLSATLDILDQFKKGDIKDRMNQSLYQSTTGRDPATGKPITNQSTLQNNQRTNSSQSSLLKSLERTLKDLQKALKGLSSSQNSSREKEKKNKNK